MVLRMRGTEVWAHRGRSRIQTRPLTSNCGHRGGGRTKRRHAHAHANTRTHTHVALANATSVSLL